MNPPAPVPPQFSQTLATTAVAPNYTPTNTPSAIPRAYQGYLASQAGFQDNQVGANKTQALGNISDANAAAAAKQKLQDINDRLNQIKDLQDPSKYQQVRTPDGGFSYFDPSGKQISIQQYSQATGKLPSDILKGSDNTLDHQYLNDYKTMEGLMNAVYQKQSNPNDPKAKTAIDNYAKQFPAIAGAISSGNINDIISNFKNHYSNIYGNPNDVYGGSRGQVGNVAFQS